MERLSILRPARRCFAMVRPPIQHEDKSRPLVRPGRGMIMSVEAWRSQGLWRPPDSSHSYRQAL